MTEENITFISWYFKNNYKNHILTDLHYDVSLVSVAAWHQLTDTGHMRQLFQFLTLHKSHIITLPGISTAPISHIILVTSCKISAAIICAWLVLVSRKSLDTFARLQQWNESNVRRAHIVTPLFIMKTNQTP